MSTPNKTPSQIEIDEIRAKCDKQIREVFSRIIGGLIQEIGEAKTTILALGEQEQALILNDEKLVKPLEELGFFRKGKRTTSKQGGERGSSVYDEAAILNFLGDEGKFEDEVMAHFGVKKQNGGSWRKKLAGKVGFDKVKPEGGKHKKYFWRKIKPA